MNDFDQKENSREVELIILNKNNILYIINVVN